MNRRSLFKMLGGAAAAYSCPLPTVAAATSVEAVLPTAVISNAFLDQIYARLTEVVSEAETRRYRDVYEDLGSVVLSNP